MRGRWSRAACGRDTWASVSPKGQVLASLAVLLPVALSGLALVALAPSLWWIFTTYFWVSFPALGLLTRGVAGLAASTAGPSTGRGGEREILEALRENGELTPARAAMETSLTVAEADGVLKALAEGGHLEAKARGGALSYALWEASEDGGERRAFREGYVQPRPELLSRERAGADNSLERSGI